MSMIFILEINLVAVNLYTLILISSIEHEFVRVLWGSWLNHGMNWQVLQQEMENFDSNMVDDGRI